MLARKMLFVLALFPLLVAAEDLELETRLYFQEADYHAKREPPELQEPYFEITSKFDEYIKSGRANDLLNEYSYLAYRGSLASMVRLCVMFGNGVGTKVEEIPAWRWCTKAAENGLPYLKKVSDRATAKHFAKPGNILEE